jgi:hypothetical protein
MATALSPKRVLRIKTSLMLKMTSLQHQNDPPISNNNNKPVLYPLPRASLIM